MTSGWGMVTAGVLVVRSAVAMSLAPPKLLRSSLLSLGAPSRRSRSNVGGSFSSLSSLTTPLRRARARGARLRGGGGVPPRPGVMMMMMMARPGRRAGDILPSAAPEGGEGGLRLPPRLAPPPPDVVRHAYSPRAGPLSTCVAAFLGWDEERATELVEFGGVYYKPSGAPATAKPKRELDPGREVETGEYLRIFPDPRRYPSFDGVDWESKIVYESPTVMLVNKPPGVPVHATVDNFGENMLAGIRGVRPGLELFLPHRLDIDTSGLVIVAKDRETLRPINDVIKGPGLSLQADGESPRARRARNKALRRAAGAVSHGDADADADGADTPEEGMVALVAGSAEASGASDAANAGVSSAGAAGTMKKRYRALVEVLPGSLPLKASPAPLTHFQRVSHRAPKDFRRHRPQPVGTQPGEEGESWIECRLRVVSATEAFMPPRPGETSLGEDAGGAEGGSGGGRRNRLQEVEVELLTGRTHQIRGQLAAEGCPIYGDWLYGPSPRRPSDPSPSPSCAAGTGSAASEPGPGGSFVLRRDSPPPPLPREEESQQPPSSPLGIKDDDLAGGSVSGGGGVGTAAAVVAASVSEEEHARTATRHVQTRRREAFVQSPKMALQACHVSIEFDGKGGEREQHDFALGRDTCWWFKEEPWVAAGLP